jgi:gliding motility-associated-like protein
MAWASHLVGGTIQVKWMGGTNYQVSVKIFRDCDPSSRTAEQPTLPDFDDPIYVGLFEKGTDKLMQSIKLDLDANAYNKLDFSGINCPSISSTGCTDLTTYTRVISMPDSKYANNAGYYLSWERCCRNKIINNIQVPGDAAISLYAEIPAARFRNSSPVYQNNPVTLMCTNTLFKYNLNFVDPDKHQLKFSLVTPLNGHLDKNNPSNPNGNGTLLPLNPQPYRPIAWNPGYNSSNAIKGPLPLSINPITGELTCIPSNAGVYVASILVEEFLNGVKIGEVRLELQFTVTNCTGNPPKTFLVTVDNKIIFPNDTVFIEIPDKTCLTIRAEKGDGSNGDSIYLNTTSPIMDSPVTMKPVFQSNVSGTGIVTTPFCIQTACEFSNFPMFPIFIEATDNSCPLNKKSGAWFWIKIKNPAPPTIQILQENGLPITSDTISIESLQKKCLKVIASAKDSLTLGIQLPSNYQFNHTLQASDTFKTGLKRIETDFCITNLCSDKPGVYPIYFESKGACPGVAIQYDTIWVKIVPMPLVNSAVLLCMTLVDNKETHLYYGDSLFGKNPLFSYYKLYRAVGNTTTSIDSTFDPNQRLFIDPNTPNYAQINYRYFIVGVNICGAEGPSSDTLGTFEQLKFIPDQQLIDYVTVQNNKAVFIDWKPSWEKDFAKYYLYKSKTNSGFQLLRTFENVNDTLFLDTDVDVQQSPYCYYLVMQDTCDNFGPEGIHSCTMLLSGNAIPFASNLNWTAYFGWNNAPLDYKVLRADPSTLQIKIAQTDSAVKQFSDKNLNLEEGIFYYTIQADSFSSSPNRVTYKSFSNTISLYQSPGIYIPNAVTSNGDGLNDIFKWVPIFIKDFNIRIYNRWGEEVYKTESKTSFWDLKFNGNLVAEDVYFYQITFTGYDDSIGSKQGSFTILH